MLGLDCDLAWSRLVKTEEEELSISFQPQLSSLDEWRGVSLAVACYARYSHQGPGVEHLGV